MSRPPTPTNPYGRGSHNKAATNYSTAASKQDDSRATEAKVLLKAARLFQELQAGWEEKPPRAIEDALALNRQIWVLFYDHALSGAGQDKPRSIDANVVNLAGFVFKRSMEILAAPAPEKLNILININREVANGLMAKKT